MDSAVCAALAAKLVFERLRLRQQRVERALGGRLEMRLRHYGVVVERFAHGFRGRFQRVAQARGPLFGVGDHAFRRLRELGL